MHSSLFITQNLSPILLQHTVPAILTNQKQTNNHSPLWQSLPSSFDAKILQLLVLSINPDLRPCKALDELNPSHPLHVSHLSIS